MMTYVNQSVAEANPGEPLEPPAQDNGNDKASYHPENNQDNGNDTASYHPENDQDNGNDKTSYPPDNDGINDLKSQNREMPNGQDLQKEEEQTAPNPRKRGERNAQRVNDPNPRTEGGRNANRVSDSNPRKNDPQSPCKSETKLVSTKDIETRINNHAAHDRTVKLTKLM